MRIIKDESIGLVIDIQERLLPHISGHEAVIENTGLLIEGLKVLDIPIIVTEQYRKGLGPTIKDIQEQIENFEPLEKMTFSCCDDDGILSEIRKLAGKFVIIAGIEAHVCVLQTTIDLISEGLQPVVVADCISSRRAEDKAIALERMRQEGALVTTYESILFELARISGTNSFKAISKLVK